jgi:hypothetical protein
MLRYFTVFFLLFSLLNVYKQNLIISGITNSSYKVLSIGFGETIFILILGFSVSSFLYVLVVVMKKSVDNMVQSQKYESEYYENAIKTVFFLLSFGLTVMIVSVYFNTGDIYQFGKYIARMESHFKGVEVKRVETQWEKLLRIEWCTTALISSFWIFMKFRHNFYKSIIISSLMLLCLILPYIKDF